MTRLVRDIRDQAIEECAEAARAAFEESMHEYVMIGPGGWRCK